jgi:hypothetical protein
MSYYYTSTFSSPADKAHGSRCWDDLVRSCHASKLWVDETDDEPTLDAITDATDPTTDAITLGKAAEESSDFFSEPYQSFDWAADDELTRSASPSMPALVHDTKSVPSLDLKFEGRYFETIIEEAEEVETEDEEEMSIISEGADFGSESGVSTELATPTPSIPDEYRPFRTPAVEPIDELLDDLSPSHISILKKLGVYSGYMHRKPITIKFPIATLSPTPHHQTNLSILAWAASTREHAPSSNLELLASCC